jgi:hypothetical protein
MVFATSAGMVTSSDPVDARGSDIVWDGGLHATAFVDNGAPLVAGDDVGWTPALLIATAVAAALMTGVLRAAAAAKIELLGYVSEQRVDDTGQPTTSSLVLTPNITVRTRASAEALEPIVLSAIHRLPSSPGYELTIEPRITVAVPASLR